MSTQYHLGKNPDGSKRWHSSDNKRELYWCGSWGDQTPLELKEIAESLLKDLRKDHPEVFLGITREQLFKFRNNVETNHLPTGRVQIKFKNTKDSFTAPCLFSAEKSAIKHWLKNQNKSEVEELTLKQVCKELGKEIKIIK